MNSQATPFSEVTDVIEKLGQLYAQLAVDWSISPVTPHSRKNPLTRHSVTCIFLLNLSVADLLHILLCAPFTLVADVLLIYWPFGPFLCRFVNYVQGVVVFLCAFTHVVLSMDRLAAIQCPIWRRRKLSATGFGRDPQFSQTEVICTRRMLTRSMKLGIPQLLSIQYVIPLVVITGTYTAIVCRVWGSPAPGEGNVQRDEKRCASKKRVSIVRKNVAYRTTFILLVKGLKRLKIRENNVIRFHLFLTGREFFIIYYVCAFMIVSIILFISLLNR
ncbi:unnamed protein product [Echinostoma caproni]|uniref:G_PROTEIN_RECEP_F1_2 domain-containing protein n=1 Tax=Echinostoma caproni TaxID=27848 RepID=A0A183ARN8_9TREM|nr:unnamed protein product [Echinostoma caproni]